MPKQFRERNLEDGLMENYKNVPQFLFFYFFFIYGLTPSQIDMFMTEDNPISRQSERVTEESIASARNYSENGRECGGERLISGSNGDAYCHCKV